MYQESSRQLDWIDLMYLSYCDWPYICIIFVLPMFTSAFCAAVWHTCNYEFVDNLIRNMFFVYICCSLLYWAAIFWFKISSKTLWNGYCIAFCHLRIWRWRKCIFKANVSEPLDMSQKKIFKHWLWLNLIYHLPMN